MKKIISLLAILLLLTSQTICASAEQSASQSTIENNLAHFPKEGIPVLMYHSIGIMYDRSICVSEKLFEEQMEWLHENNYHTVNSDELYEALSGKTALPDNPILITFDDGFGDNYKVAWPILKHYGFNATFFIVTSQVNPYNIDWNQLKELVEQGNSIGSHSVNHYDLATLNTKQQEKELRKSKEVLEEKLDTSIKAFCFPYGSYNKTTIALLPKSGYLLSFTVRSGKVYLGDNEYLLKRVHICGGEPLSSFIKKIT